MEGGGEEGCRRVSFASREAERLGKPVPVRLVIMRCSHRVLATASRPARRLLSTAAAPMPPESTLFPGARSAYTSELKFWYPSGPAPPTPIPCFRLTDDIGRPVPGAEVPEISREMATACMWTMVRVNEFDKIFNDAQRQGRISFYMTSRGEEACSVASAMAPPEPPSPITTATFGTPSARQASVERAMASAWPRSSASMPG